VIIISAYSCIVYHFYEVESLKLQTMEFFMQTLENPIFDEVKDNNSALSQ